ncbi:MAG TPA: DUF2202 domain-containing protein [Bacteroidales bacterium]|nr:DUF2202 domain-containing protein [Bacteroidales bacterium]
MKFKAFKTSAAFLLSATILVTSCEKNSANSNDLFAPFLTASADGISFMNEENLLSSFIDTPEPGIEEMNLLIRMREEEKLARDVYTSLYTKWGHMVFTRISSAETTHLNAVNSLLKLYASPDVVISDPGVFKDKHVQDLYDDLITKGSSSLSDAFKVGALIEEMDIKDLKNALNKTSNPNIIMVFENLERGSRNHLRAFTRQLSNIGITYVPEYLLQEEYNKIVSSPVETGNRYRMQNKGIQRGRHNR